MAKKFEKKLLSSAMAVALASGVGFSGAAHAIHISADGEGQLLMAPLYLAWDALGYNSKVSISNTRDDTAVKVRISLRSQKYSDEFDFVCLMSPSDVCRFEIVQGEGGHAYLESTDDSILADRSKPVFASQCASTDAALVGEYCQNGKFHVKVQDRALRADKDGVPLDMNEIGHMEVLGSWAAQGRIYYADGPDNVINVNSGPGVVSDDLSVLVEEGMSKAELYKIMGPQISRAKLAQYRGQDESRSYATGRMDGAGNCVDAPEFRNAPGSRVAMDVSAFGAPCNVARGVLPSSRVRSTDPSWIQLYGEVQMDNGIDRMGMKMTALDGDVWDNLMPIAHNPPYGIFSFNPSSDIDGDGLVESFAFDGRIISNPGFDFDFGAYLEIGATFGGSRVGLGDVAPYDNIVEIENALAASQLEGTYENKDGNITNLIITFPTKYKHDSSVVRRMDTLGEPGGTGPTGEIDLGDSNDVRDVCASMWVGDTNAEYRHALGDPTLYDGRNFYPPFTSEGSVMYKLTVWDDQEHINKSSTVVDIFSPKPTFEDNGKAITEEVNYMWIEWPTSTDYDFGSGRYSVEFGVTRGCQYSGVPVLAYAHKTQFKNNGFVNSWLAPLTRD
jgi:hypothetical protein